MSVTSGNWTNGSLGPWRWFSMAQPRSLFGLPLFPPDPSSLAWGHWPNPGVKVLETGSNPLKLLHVTSPEAVTETAGQGILPGFLRPSEWRMMESRVGGFSRLQSANIASKSFQERGR